MKEFNFFEKLTQEEKEYLLENSKYVEIQKGGGALFKAKLHIIKKN